MISKNRLQTLISYAIIKMKWLSFSSDESEVDIA